MLDRTMSEKTNEEAGAIGIGAMIVFIALILVAAVASAVIIQTGEKLQQSAQTTGDDTNDEIGGKITFSTAWIASLDTGEAATVTMVYELAAGSEEITEANINWVIACDDDGNIAAEFAQGDFQATHTLADAALPDGDAAGTDEITPGQTYMITVDMGLCEATAGQTFTMQVEVEDGSSTLELLSFNNIAVGETVI